MKLAMHQSIDISGLQRSLISLVNIQYHSAAVGEEIEALKEELLFMKNHEEEVNGPWNQIANSGLTVELDAPKSQDVSKIRADIWAQYDRLAWKNARS